MPDQKAPEIRSVPSGYSRIPISPVSPAEADSNWLVRGPNDSEYTVRVFFDPDDNIFWYHLPDKRVGFWNKR